MVCLWLARIVRAARRIFRKRRAIRRAIPPNLPAIGDWARLRGHQSDERLGRVLWIDKHLAGIKWIVGGDGRALPDEPSIVHLYELEKVS